MKLTLIITTYERPDALAAVLRSVAGQSLPPDEVIVADDGSGPATAEVVGRAASELNIVHEWREHDGFRAARMRNCALARASGEYIVLIDGDILLHPNFLADHLAVAKPGCFVFGGRAMLDSELSREAVKRERYWPSFFTKGVGKRHHLIRSRALSRLFRKPNRFHYVKSCNLAFWRDDAVRINGFNEDFVGWGAEDNEFVVRLTNCGVIGLALLYGGLGCHLHHPRNANDRLEANHRLLKNARENHAVWCENGLNRHMVNAGEESDV